MSYEQLFRKDILVLGGGRWAQVYIKELIEINDLYCLELRIYVISRTKFTDLRRKYIWLNMISVHESEESISLGPGNKFDLAIIATSLKYHFKSLISCIDKSRHILLEKPGFSNLKEHDIFLTKAKGFIDSQNINISCPYLFSKSVNLLAEQEKSDASNISGRWIERVPHPLGYKYDANVAMTAISHLLPVICFLAKVKYKDFVWQKNGPNDITFKCTKSIDKKVNINLHCRRSEDLSFTKSITFKGDSGEKIECDLMNNEAKKYGISIIARGIHIRQLTPLKSQILYCLLGLNTYHNYISLSAYRAISALNFLVSE